MMILVKKLTKSNKNKSIFLFYKSIIQWGGAENFLQNEFKVLSKMGYEVKIICFNIKREELKKHWKSYDKKLLILKGNYILSIFKLIFLL